MKDEMAKEATGIALKGFRTRLHLTQFELGERIGASRAQIAQWEIGRAPVPEKFLFKLRELGFSLSPDEWPIVPIAAATRKHLKMLVDILSDASIESEIRSAARDELLRCLAL